MIPPQFICFDFAFIYAHGPREAWCGSVFMQVDVKHSSDFMGIGKGISSNIKPSEISAAIFNTLSL